VSTREDAIAKVRSGEALAALVVPEDATDRLRRTLALSGGEPPTIEVYYNASDPLKQQLVETTIRARLAEANDALSDAVLTEAARYIDIIVRGGQVSLPLVGNVDILGLQRAHALIAAAAAPFALAVLVPRSRARDVSVVALQMLGYLAGYEMPNDDPAALRARVRVEYPVRLDRRLGGGMPPTLRLQRALGTPGHFKRWEKALVWSHWLWFFFPHGTVAYVLARHRDRFPLAAAQVYATFDLGLIGYWAVPTAPPWYAAERGLFEDGRTPQVRRMMVEYGEQFWRSGWGPLYGVLAGNPLAAMPSLHFATSVTAAHVLWRTGRLAGALGWAYALTLGVALVYLGEHYVVDLLAGLALAELVRMGTPVAAPLAARLSAAVQALEAQAAA
jgi:hypothetical protein